MQKDNNNIKIQEEEAITIPIKNPMEVTSIKTIAKIRTDFPAKFGIPRQSGIVDSLKAIIIFEPQYRNPDALRGLEGFSHIWLIWKFFDVPGVSWSPMVKPPRLGGNQRMGVFATRSPYRPNPIGLSCVKLECIEQNAELGPILHIRGADLMDYTPIYDIKPYLSYTDSHPEAAGGFADPLKDYALEVVFPQHWLQFIPADRREALFGVLAHDPRPSYQNDPDRIYGLWFAGFNVRFTVMGMVLTVCEVTPIDSKL